MQEKTLKFSLLHFNKMLLKSLRYGRNYKRQEFPVYIYFGKRITAYVYYGPIVLCALPLIIYLIANAASGYETNALFGFSLMMAIGTVFWYIISSIFLMLTLNDRIVVIQDGMKLDYHDFSKWRCHQYNIDISEFEGVFIKERKWNNKDMHTKYSLNVVLKHPEKKYSVQLTASPGMRFRSRNRFFIRDMEKAQKEWARFLGVPELPVEPLKK